MSLISERIKVVKGLDPVADALSATVYSDSISLSKYGQAAFLVYKGVGATGTSLFTVEASSDASRTSAEAIPFRYRRVASGDTAGDIQNTAATGFTSSAQSSELYIVEVEASACPNDKPWVSLKAVESVDSPVAACVIALLDAAKYPGEDLPTAIA